MSFEWAVTGMDEVLELTFKLKDFENAIRPITTIWGNKMLLYRIKGPINYPPAPATSTYVRTNTLGNAWVHEDTGHHAFAFYNPTQHAHWVVGDNNGQHQAGHMGHWWIARQRILEGLPGLEGDVEGATRAWYRD